MKFNWGHGLAVGMVLFIAYILFMVVQAVTMDFDLETEDYYSKELNYQNTIDKSENFDELESEVLVKIENGNQLVVAFPQNNIDSGTIKLFRPSDKNLDRSFEIALDSSGAQWLDIKDFTKGRYILETEWWNEGKGFFDKQNIVL